MKRRDFFNTGAATLFLALAQKLGFADNIKTTQGIDMIPKRLFKDDVHLSVLGFGGILVLGNEQKRANKMVRDAFDRGINYFDVAPQYGDGEAEIKLGPALKPVRNQTFLACKTLERDAQGARNELERSLKRLHTDHFDLYQLHAVTTQADVDQITAPGGALETFIKAKEQGKIRYIGFSAHSVNAALQLLDLFPFDSILFPINFVCYGQGHFGPQVVKKAIEKGTARLALKALAYTPWPEGMERKYSKCWYRPVDDEALARKALAFTLSENITAAIPPGDETLFQLAMKLVPALDPLSGQERADLLAETQGLDPLFRA